MVNETDYVPEPRASKIDKEEAPRPFPWEPDIERSYSKQGSEYVNVARAARTGMIVKHGPGHVEVVLVLPMRRDVMPVFPWQQHLEQWHSH